MTQEELNRVQVGSVLRNIRTGTLRVVRDVSRVRDSKFKRTLKQGDVFCITFAIKNCSWTKRPYTVYNRYDIKRQFELTNVRVKLNSEIDALLAQEMDNSDKPFLTCCAVRGLP